MLNVGTGNESLLWSVPFPLPYISHKSNLIPRSSPPPTVSLQTENAWGRGYVGLALNPGFPFWILSHSFDFSPKLCDKIRNGKPGFEANIGYQIYAGICGVWYVLIIVQCTHSVSLYCKMVAQQATRSPSIWRQLEWLQVKDESSTSWYEQVYSIGFLRLQLIHILALSPHGL